MPTTLQLHLACISSLRATNNGQSQAEEERQDQACKNALILRLIVILIMLQEEGEEVLELIVILIMLQEEGEEEKG